MPSAPSNPQPQFSNPRYHILDTIGRGGMGIVHRTLDRLTGETVALKQVTDARKLQVSNTVFANQTVGALRLALAHEFQTLAGLRHPNIISVLDYGFDTAQKPFFTMTYLPDAKTLLQAGEGLPLAKKVELIEQLLQALAYLHRRGVLHRDLKPENVLVSNSVVRVLDFGLAASHTATDTSTGGTAFFTAPEIWEQTSYSPAADLYAVGVIACELLTGQHPFGPFDNGFLDRVLDAEPNLKGLEPKLAAVLAQLLAKDPTQRFQHPEAVLAALAEAAGLPIPEETTAIRESFLQAATFVGRAAELQKLKAALTEAKQGHGSAWLVGGESGVGKSRLLDELRTQALVNGFQVLRGQGVEGGGGLPFQIWRDPVKHLIMTSPEVDDLVASVFLPLVPDLPLLLDRIVAAAPEIDEKAAQTRLFTLLAQLFWQAKRPILLILEDVQWAEESLLPIHYLTRRLGKCPLLIIGSYRSDEYPELPKQLPDMHALLLARLTANDMAALSVAMLGAVGTHPRVLELLQRETEGNAFFAVEVVRALAEQTGRLSDINDANLPETVLPNGIQDILQRRLARIPLKDQGILQLAAVVGRVLDFALLRRLRPNLDFDGWLLTCAEAAVLEVADNQWRFSHDKLREAVLASLSMTQQPLLHQKVAEAIEAVYPDNLERADILLEHWRVAGHVAQEVKYLLVVVERDQLTRQNLKRNQRSLQRGLTLVGTLSNSTELYMTMLRHLGDIANELGEIATAKEYHTQSLALAERLKHDFGRAKALHGLGKAVWRENDLDGALRYFQASLELAQSANLREEIAPNLTLLGVINAIKAHYRQARVYWLEALTLHRARGERRGIAHTLNNLGIVARINKEYADAQSYATEALSIFREINDFSGMALALNDLGKVARVLGDYAVAEQHLSEAFNLANEASLQMQMIETRAARGRLAVAQGQWQAARHDLHQALTLAHKLNAWLLLMETLVGFVHYYQAQGRLGLAAELTAFLHGPAHAPEDMRDETSELMQSTQPPTISKTELAEAQACGQTWNLNQVVGILLEREA